MDSVRYSSMLGRSSSISELEDLSVDMIERKRASAETLLSLLRIPSAKWLCMIRSHAARARGVGGGFW